MSTVRIALANLPYPPTPGDSVTMATDAVARASAAHADLICFPECFDPSEEALLYVAADSARHVFQAGPLTFGISICHEGWRYPETVRWPARHGAHIVFHPHFHEAEAGSYRPTTFADPANSFHEKAALCRAAENTCFFASVNYASIGSPTTSAVVGPDGTLLTYQPYGTPGLLIADLDITKATGLLAARFKAP